MAAAEDEVWDLHLAFSETPDSHRFYSPTPEDAQSIREYTQNSEAELAFDLILAIASPDLPDGPRTRAYRVGQLLAPDETAADVRAYVDGWLRWSLGSSEQPPAWT